ncbi:MAG: hypothetical protein OXH11_19725, partial [Candidatus Aminicenantes bacterium]|nr:hypothetical protein [Candidatus Aminicenantes bacterium]
MQPQYGRISSIETARVKPVPGSKFVQQGNQGFVILRLFPMGRRFLDCLLLRLQIGEVGKLSDEMQIVRVVERTLDLSRKIVTPFL